MWKVDWTRLFVRQTRRHTRAILLMLAAGAALLLASMAPFDTEARVPVSIPRCASENDAAQAASSLPVTTQQLASPAITAQAAVVIDAETGRVLYDLDAHTRRAPASTTKIMTAILTIERDDLDKVVTTDIDARDLIGSSVMGLRPDLPITVRDLLYGLMLPSGNDAAIELAKSLSGDVQSFVGEMNKKAEELGLQDTHFMNPHGLDRHDHYSSAYDLAQLARYAMRNPTFADVVGTGYYQLSPPWDYPLTNGNTLLGSYDGADGVKIGWTEDAGWTLVASVDRDGHRLIATVLNSEDRDADAAALFDWSFASHEWMQVSDRTNRTLRLASLLGIGDGLAQAVAVCD